jgi:surface polysaccharide O-acyltransferase-like enzyme
MDVASKSRTIETAVPVAQTRLLHLDALRVGAIFLVVFNHTGERGFTLWTVAEGPLMPLYLFLSILCKIAVPLFFMASGALLIPKDESVGIVLRRRALRFALVLVLFSLLQYLLSAETHSVSGFLRDVYSTWIVMPYWFLYAYLGILLLLPFLRRLARHMTIREFLYLVGLQFVFVGLMPIVDSLLSTGPSKVSVAPMVGLPVFFFLTGYFFQSLPPKYLTGRWVAVAGAAGLVCIGAAGFMLWLTMQRTGEPDQSFYNALIAPPTFAAFLVARYLDTKLALPEWLNRTVTGAASVVFVVYLVESLLRPRLLPVFETALPHVGSLWASVCWVFAVIGMGAVIGAVLRQVPLLRRLL